MDRFVSNLIRFILGIGALAGGAVLFINAAQFTLASRHLDSGLLPPPPTAKTWLDQKRWMQLGSSWLYSDPASAVTAWENALRTDPVNASSWSQLSVAYFYSGLPHKGSTAAQRALGLSPKRASIALEQALLAADFWEMASPEAQTLWHANLDMLGSQMLASIVHRAVSTNRDVRLCNLVEDLSPYSDFCANTVRWRTKCSTATPQTPRLFKGCRRRGYPVGGTTQ